MNKSIRLSFIGYGNMGRVFVEAIAKAEIVSSKQIIVADPRAEKLEQLHREWGVKTTTNNQEAVREAGIVLLAVKPQQMRDVLQEFKDVVQPQALVISIAAGFTISSIAQALERENQPIIRVMPNLAATVGKSVSGWIANSHVSDEQKKTTKQLLQAVGMEFVVDSEEMLDVVTAVSGSGPAYYYYFTEALIDGAKKLGMGEKEATELAVQTFVGAATLLESSRRSPGELRAAVTSKGGTTEAALKVLAERDFKQLITDALLSAKQRAFELRT